MWRSLRHCLRVRVRTWASMGPSNWSVWEMCSTSIALLLGKPTRPSAFLRWRRTDSRHREQRWSFCQRSGQVGQSHARAERHHDHARGRYFQCAKPRASARGPFQPDRPCRKIQKMSVNRFCFPDISASFIRYLFCNSDKEIILTYKFRAVLHISTYFIIQTKKSLWTYKSIGAKKHFVSYAKITLRTN